MPKLSNLILYIRSCVSKKAVIFSAWLLMGGSVWGQSPTSQPSYQVDHWTTDNGLPQNTVRNVLQTRDGYLWLATYDGLVRFDGVRFTIFNKSNTPGLNSNRFLALGEDRHGTLWAGTEDGGVTAYRDGVFKTYTTADGLISNSIGIIRIDGNGEFYQLKGFKFAYWRGNGFIKGEPLYDANVSSFYWGSSGKLWKMSLTSVTESKGGWEVNYPVSQTGGTVGDLTAIEDRQGDLWMNLAYTREIYQLRNGHVTRYSEKEGVPKGMSLRPVCEDSEGGIWFCVNPWLKEATGLVRLKDGRFTYFGSENGLPKALYYSVTADREGTIWAGTSQGLYRLKRKAVTTYSTENGLLHNETYPLLRARNGDIYIGSAQGLSRFHDGKFEGGILLDRPRPVQALWEDRAGRLWIGLVAGLFVWDQRKLVDWAPQNHYSVVAIQGDSLGAVWVAGEAGIMKFQGDQLVATYRSNEGLPNNRVTVIHEIARGPHKGEMWFGTYGGLAQFKDGRFINFTTAQGLAGNYVRSIYEDAEGTLWIGTYDEGLSRFRDGKFFNYRTEQGLYSNGVFQILEDKHGYFWISCNTGIYRVSRQELNDFAEGRIPQITSQAFGKLDGMLNIECNGGRQPAGLVTKDGKFWFPTMGGVAVVDPESAKFNPQPPPVLIESVAIERHNVDFRNGVTVQADQRDIEINYTGLSFIKPEQVKFKYKLEGVGTDWVDAGTRRVVYLPYLPAGSYTFRVIAANSDGVWNTIGANVRIVVLAPFWRTWWFALISVLGAGGILLGLLVLGWKLRVKKLEMERANQYRFSQQLIESQDFERNRIAAELHDGLGQRLLVIKNWAEFSLTLAPTDSPNREYLNEISESASLALEETRRVVLDLRPHQLDKIGLANALRFTVEQVAESSGIDIQASIADLDGAFSPKQEVSIYRIIQECLNNIIKHSGATQARVVVERDVSIRLCVSDNGHGVVSDPLNPKQKGFGLSGIEERTKMLGGKYRMDSRPGKGTTIEILISGAPQGKGNNESRNQHRDG